MPGVVDTLIPAPAYRAGFYPFENGDRMDQIAFHKLYSKTDAGVRAELIEGVVFVKMPTKLLHGSLQTRLSVWASTYAAQVPWLEILSGTTVKLNRRNEVEPDLLIFVRPECGGQISIDKDDFLCGAPEFVLEIANSTQAIDLGDKKNAYEQAGVKEYCVVLGHEKRIRWHVRKGRSFKDLSPINGVFQSQIFPGLWLEEKALFRTERGALNKALNDGLKSGEFRKFMASKKQPLPPSNGHAREK